MVHSLFIQHTFLTYELSPLNIIYSNQSTKKFENISDLRIYTEPMKCKGSYYFPNVTSLTLERAHENFGDGFPTTNDVPFLKMIVNLSAVKHLRISSPGPINSSPIVLELLKETSQLSSIAFDAYHFYSFKNDDQLCQYFNKIIQNENFP